MHDVAGLLRFAQIGDERVPKSDGAVGRRRLHDIADDRLVSLETYHTLKMNGLVLPINVFPSCSQCLSTTSTGHDQHGQEAGVLWVHVGQMVYDT